MLSGIVVVLPFHRDATQVSAGYRSNHWHCGPDSIGNQVFKIEICLLGSIIERLPFGRIYIGWFGDVIDIDAEDTSLSLSQQGLFDRPQRVAPVRLAVRPIAICRNHGNEIISQISSCHPVEVGS